MGKIELVSQFSLNSFNIPHRAYCIGSLKNVIWEIWKFWILAGFFSAEKWKNLKKYPKIAIFGLFYPKKGQKIRFWQNSKITFLKDHTKMIWWNFWPNLVKIEERVQKNVEISKWINFRENGQFWKKMVKISTKYWR